MPHSPSPRPVRGSSFCLVGAHDLCPQELTCECGCHVRVTLNLSVTTRDSLVAHLGYELYKMWTAKLGTERDMLMVVQATFAAYRYELSEVLLFGLVEATKSFSADYWSLSEYLEALHHALSDAQEN